MSIKKISGHDHRATINDAISKSAFIKRWPPPEGYLNAYLKHIDKAFAAYPNQKFLILDAIPEMKVPTFKCLYNNNKTECRTKRSIELNYLEKIHSGLVAIVSRRKNVRLINLFDAICDNDYCANISKGKVIYRDDDHLSNTFVAKQKELFINLIKN